MGIEFKLKDFAYPFSLLRLKRTFDKNQWLGEEALREYQLERLKLVIDHAYAHVPFYKKVFKEKGIEPGDIKKIDDLKNIPYLTKKTLRKEFDALKADNAARYKPQLVATSGTGGERTVFYADKTSNILEFVYYWRLWGWYGYRLGETVAELSTEYFMRNEKLRGINCHFDQITRRLLINAFSLSVKNTEEYKEAFKKYRPRFLKGLPSNLTVLALLFKEKKDHNASFDAVFSQGENLYDYQRSLIKEVFSARTADCYGHMERTAAISQCPEGTYHIHQDYGLVELVEPEFPIGVQGHLHEGNAGNNVSIKEITGTSLHNYAMPLIRYRTGDYVCVAGKPGKCSCNRGFQEIVSLIGRDSDIVVTPDGKVVTALYVALNRTPGILWGQFVQNDAKNLTVRVVYDTAQTAGTDSLLMENTRALVGSEMDIEIVHEKFIPRHDGQMLKSKVVISKICREGSLPFFS